MAGVNCNVFEDNSGALAIATLLQIIPRTKYINNKNWHLREHMKQRKISIHAVQRQIK